MLPSTSLYAIIRFLTLPTSTCHVLSFQISLLSAATNRFITAQDELWHQILLEYSSTTSQSTSSRASKRLRKTTKEFVMREHIALCKRTETAHYLLTELIHNRQHPLSLLRLRALFPRDGPSLRINQRAQVGGTFLVEVCRARFVEEKAILRCVKELVALGASPDVSTGMGPGPNGEGGLTPLCVAAARGMSSVVEYFTGAAVNASKELRGEGRFRLFGDGHQSLSGSFTPLGWAAAMLAAETSAGVSDLDLTPLRKCMQVLGASSTPKGAAQTTT